MKIENKNEMNLWQRMSAIMSEVNYVQKKMTVGEGKYSYKGLSSKDLYEKINESMVKWGVVCVQKSFTFERFYYEGKGWDSYNKREKDTFQREVIGTYTGILINIDSPDQKQEISGIGQGIDSQDKASGKAQTYALKQALLNTFIIATGVDTDNVHSDKLTEEFSNKKPKEEKKQSKPVQPTNQKPILTEKAKNFKAICAALEDGTRTMAMLDEVLEIKGPIRDVLEKIEAIRVANKVINQTK